MVEKSPKIVFDYGSGGFLGAIKRAVGFNKPPNIAELIEQFGRNDPRVIEALRNQSNLNAAAAQAYKADQN
jgi:hypothetical protein